ncbi:MAG: TolC family protein [Candidatus Zixiibacteriota bacterium]
MRMKPPMFFVFAMMLTASMASDNPNARDLTLQQALQLARQHSHRLKRAAEEQRAANAALGSARAARMPTLSFQAAAFYRDDIPSLEIAFPFGQGFTREIGSKENYQTDIRISLPLFTGGRISGGIGAATATAEARRALKKAAEREVLHATWVGYLSLYRSSQLLRTTQASLERAQIINRDVRAMFAVGAADSVDLLDADLALAEAELKVKEARTARRSDEIKLAILLGLPSTEEITLVSRPPHPGSAIIAHEFHTRPELEMAEAGVELNRAEVQLARASFLPHLSLYGGYSYGKPNLDIFNKAWNDYFTLGANLTWSFSLGGGQIHDTRRARYEYQAAQRELDRVTEDISEQVDLMRQYLALAGEQYATAERRYEVAKDNYRLGSERHRSGTLSSNRLLEIETALTASEAALESARVEFHLARFDYLLATGSDALEKGF